MSDSEGEWQTVRRRRGPSRQAQQALQRLPLPVKPLAFNAISPYPAEEVSAVAGTAKKKKPKKKAAQASETQPQKLEADQSGPASRTSAVNLGTTVVSGKPASNPPTDAIWLLQLLYALVAWLKSLLGLGAIQKSKKKRKVKAAPLNAKEEIPAATPAKPEAAAGRTTATGGVAGGAESYAAAKATPIPQNATSTPMKASSSTPAAPSSHASTPVPSTAKVTTAKSLVAANPTAARGGSTKQQGEAATTKDQQVGLSSVPSPHAAGTAIQTPAQAAAAASTATPAAAAPSAPSNPCDPDWERGKVLLTTIPQAHGSDVVPSVALCGSLAVSAGYGTINVWSWPRASQSSPAAVAAPTLKLTKTLVGHSGKVEALCADAGSMRLASAGRDCHVKVWALGSKPDGSAAAEAASHYTFESLKSLDVDWAAGRAAVGARSGTILMYNLETGRKLGTFKGHSDEVMALRLCDGLSATPGAGGGGSLLISGSKDCTVRLWDTRMGSNKAPMVLHGLSGKVYSLAVSESCLYAGDVSSTIKVWDLRKVLSASPRDPCMAPQRLPNAPSFAGAPCPTAGLWYGARDGVLVSSSLAWWTDNKQALEEAPADATLPMACLNVSAATPDGQHAYKYTLRTTTSIITALASDGDRLLAGTAGGSLLALQLVRGGSKAVVAAEKAALDTAGCEVVDALAVGVEAFEDEGEEDGSEDSEAENSDV